MHFLARGEIYGHDEWRHPGVGMMLGEIHDLLW
jgi:hypothetical protein